MSDPRLRTSQWQQLRRAILARDGWRCQIKDEGCLGIATETDHIVPSVEDPAGFWDTSNLRASCAPCNRKRGAQVSNRRGGGFRSRGRAAYPPVRM